MALVAIRYLGDDTRNGINQIEDWFLPPDAFATKFFDDAGRRLYLMGTREQILAEDAKLSRNSLVEYQGHAYAYDAPEVEVVYEDPTPVQAPTEPAPVETPVDLTVSDTVIANT